MELVKDIIVNLARDVRETREQNKSYDGWKSIPVERFLRKEMIASVRPLTCAFSTSFDTMK